MNRCPNCAAQNREGAKFCTSCGFKLPVSYEPSATTISDRSPFATTSHIPSSSAVTSTQADAPAQEAGGTADQGYATWGAESTSETIGPGQSWNAGPPKDTAVPVSDEMIETLVGGYSPEEWAASEQVDTAGMTADEKDRSAIETPVGESATSAPTVDHLLTIARELEYGLIELAESWPAAIQADKIEVSGDTAGLGGVLADLQSDDELQALRNAVQTARERPRDVDVMLDLVLRAEAIATVIDERDRLKAAIEVATSGSSSDAVDDSTELEGVEDQAPDLSDVAEDDTESSPYAST